MAVSRNALLSTAGVTVLLLAGAAGLQAHRAQEDASRAAVHPQAPTADALTAGQATQDAVAAVGPDEAARTAATTTVYSVAMHMHGSISEGDAGMTWHTNQAITNHIDVLWWSDHDVFYYPDGAPNVTGYDFESGGKAEWITGWPSSESVYVQWTTDTAESNPPPTYDMKVNAVYAHSGNYGGRLQATASADGVDQRITYYLDVSPRFQFKSLLGDVNLSFWVMPITTSASGELQITVPLSGTHSGANYPPNDDHKSIVFYHGSVAHPSISDDGNTIYVPITAATNAWTEVTANLTDLAVAAWGEEGRDLHGEMITAREIVSNGATVKYNLDDFSWSMTHTGDDLRTQQANYLATLGSSPVQLLGQEISEVDPGHLNVFGSSVPILPYASSQTWDGPSVTDWVHGFGGLVSYNHMFGVSMNRDDDATRAANVADRTDDIIANDMWGADLLEVGYRQRNGLEADFLQVWDAIGMAGLYKTGIGAFDLHDELDFATFTNNLVTFVPLTTAFSESALITELKKGNCFFGDPTYFTNGHVTLTLTTATPAAKMGNVVVGQKSNINVTFTASQVPAGSVVSLVQNGVVTNTWNYATSRRISTTVSINPVGGNVVRFEIESTTGNPIAYTNPIYFVDSDPAATVPTDRKIQVRAPR